MTDLEISRRLALAIGWPESRIYNDGDGSFCSVNLSDQWFIECWKDFDYRDPSVIWPIAEKFDAFPFFTDAGEWLARVYNSGTEWLSGDTAAKAVALAVIKAHEEKMTPTPFATQEKVNEQDQ